ncbi:hypothetical protein CBS101457_003243 [Exobasidium rhododendri]|nr:hypothetical protein CBS101457_003243 [Exobasidium rhododendri]
MVSAPVVSASRLSPRRKTSESSNNRSASPTLKPRIINAQKPPDPPTPVRGVSGPQPGQIDWNTILLYSLIGVNALVYVGWQYAINAWEKHKDPRPWLWMNENFLSGEVNLLQGRPWTLLTSCISHDSFGHFAVNMVSFTLMSPPIIQLVGPAAFLGLYFGAGLISSAISIGWKKYLDPYFDMGPRDKTGKSLSSVPGYSHGASGSIYAVLTTFACVQPRATFLLFVVIPAPAWAVVPGIIAWDLFSAVAKPGQATSFFSSGIIDSAGHVGGAVAGVLFWRYYLRGLRIR